MKAYQTIKDCLGQLVLCGYETNEGHPLENNIAFVRLQEIASSNYQPRFFLNEPVYYNNTVCFVMAIVAASASHPYPEVEYHLSTEWNRASTTNKADYTYVPENAILSVQEYEDNKVNEALEYLKSKGVIPQLGHEA